MNKSPIALIVSLFAILLLAFTNPKDEEHKAAVKAKANEFIQKSMKQNAASSDGLGALGALFGSYIINQMVDMGVTRNNYLLFSTTNLTYEGKSRMIGVGLLGNVFITSKIDEAIKKAKP